MSIDLLNNKIPVSGDDKLTDTGDGRITATNSWNTRL